MSPKLSRLLLVATVAAGFGILPIPGAQADAAVVVHDLPTGFQQANGASGQCKNTKDPNQMPRVDVNKGDSVNWYFDAGNQDKHNVTPANDVAGGQKWPAGVNSNDKAPGDPDPVIVTFNNPGLYFYYSNFNGEGSENKGQLSGMCGVVRVIDPNATTTTSTPPDTAPPATQPPATTPSTAPPATTGTTAPASAIPSATHPVGPAAPAPTTTATSKPEKDKKAKDETTTTTTAPQVNGPTDLPAEAIVPNLTPGATATQDGAVLPSSTPTGDATAVIKHKHGHGSVILLVFSGLGIGGLGVGTAIYKWANRSSQYFPA